MSRDEYVAVACDDWYQRRRRDAEGRFFMRVSEQSPRKGGSTRQGIYLFTAGGELLAYKNAGQNAEVMRDMLREGLEKWKRLPALERTPGGVTVPEHGEVDRAYHRTPPPGGVVIKVYARALDYQNVSDQKSGAPLFADAQCQIGAGDEASRDHLWLTFSEWRSLIPADLRKGAESLIDPKISERIFRFHLVDNTRGEPSMWGREDLRSGDLKLVVDDIAGEEVVFHLAGSAVLRTNADPEKAARGYEPRIFGFIRYDRRNQRLTAFDVVSIGDHWGSGSFTRRGERGGRTPLGIAFELSPGNSPAECIAPQGARELNEYFGR